MTKPLVVAHRGNSAVYAENSWAAFEEAVNDGADAIECDVQGTRDGVLVIRHDLAVGNRLVAECTAAEIEAMEPGLVRLADLIAWAQQVRISLLVEVKDPDFAVPVGQAVGASAWRDHIVIGGFHGPALAEVKRRMPKIRTSLMMGSVVAPEDLVRLAIAYHANGIHPCWEARSPHPHRLLDTAAVALLRKAGLAVTLWHEERESELQALVALAPDAICTDTPATLRRIVDTYAIGNAAKVRAKQETPS